MIETYRGVVTPSEIDLMGHMNVKFYSEKFDQATWRFFNAIGITVQYIEKEKKGCVAVEITASYRKELFAGSPVSIKTGLLDIAGKKIRLLHTMYDDQAEEIAATCELLGVHFDLARRKSLEFPPHILEKALIYKI